MGVISRKLCPYKSAQNGRAERKHRHVIETGLTLLAQASMPLSFWWDAFSTAVYLINGLPTNVLQGKSPIQLMMNTNLDFANLRVFGCSCYLL